MRWLGLWGERKPIPSKTEPLVESSVVLPETETFGIVTIDMPNIVYRGYNDSHESYYVHWHVLLDHILPELEHTRALYKGAYQTLRRRTLAGARWEERARLRWNESDFALVTNKRSDIDSYIVNDLWQSVATLLENKEKAKVKLVLVSGDGGYVRTLKAIQETYPTRLSLDAIVYTWRNSLSAELEAFVGSENIRYLDDIAGIVKNPAVPAYNQSDRRD